MQFLVVGLDGKDEQAQDRRFAVRQQHLALGDEMEAGGFRWYGASLRDSDDNMIGSFAVMDFPSRKELDDWLTQEPYVVGDVWQDVQVFRCAVRDPWKFGRPREFFDGHRFYVGCIYEDCAFQPVLCTAVDYEEDELVGISLIDGSEPSCSIHHCGAELINAQQAQLIKSNFERYVEFRKAGGAIRDFS